MENRLRLDENQPVKLANCPGMQETHTRGHHELIAFATETLECLISHEHKILQRSTGLQLFCHMDIGVIQLPNGRLEYWVNEIDHTPNASLFACNALNWTETLAIEFAMFLPKYLGLMV